MKTRIAISTALLSACLLTTSAARADDAFFGAILGGGAGALVGKSLGGRDGAIIGGALGAAAGVAIADQHRAHINYAPQPVYYRQPAMFAPVPVYYVRSDRYWVDHRDHGWERHHWEHEHDRHEYHHDHDHDHDYDRGWDR